MSRIYLFQILCLSFLILHTNVFGQHKKDSIIAKSMKLITPDYLKKGDSIAIVAPAGILKNKEEVVQKAKELAESWGLKVVLGKHVFNQENHFAGTDNERAADFQKALDAPNIKAIWCARGGYGSVRILDKLDFTKFKKQPKWIVGYSDITAIHNHIHTLGVESIHAMMTTSLDDESEEIAETISTFKKALFGDRLEYEISSSEYNETGEVSGQIVGGNLTLLMTMLGSKSSISMDGKILFFEEIGEYKYHIDRMLQSLKRAGYFENCKGIIVGDISRIRKNTTPWGASIEELIKGVLAEYDFPVLFDFPAGHESKNLALIMGRTIKLSVKEKTSKIIFE